MLVLSRKKDESVVINNDIRIVVVEIRGDKVRLGVEAPKEVPVHRSEVYEASNGDWNWVAWHGRHSQYFQQYVQSQQTSIHRAL